ncbi:hypothetical protein PBI_BUZZLYSEYEAR_98 [Mycobacterium phage BuzzLyseyear]|uniref:Uncharacterized protein n=1 Tax=Mycobacterium phage BuzzLyseyear TaxID=1536598 RepID=A0A088FPR5_9CAUD|nr:hypothetical protein PBI_BUZZLYSEYEAR_98 [Mycobacterium phage BuzzLyseyear]AIM50220.1 hypothetical protein PBI_BUZZLYSEYEAR_98 [Mycobacterium phage BuzzLyseyear]
MSEVFVRPTRYEVTAWPGPVDGLSVILASQARFLTESPVCPACFQPRTEHSTDCKGHHK